TDLKAGSSAKAGIRDRCRRRRRTVEGDLQSGHGGSAKASQRGRSPQAGGEPAIPPVGAGGDGVRTGGDRARADGSRFARSRLPARASLALVAAAAQDELRGRGAGG